MLELTYHFCFIGFFEQTKLHVGLAPNAHNSEKMISGKLKWWPDLPLMSEF
jgi:hypothetical protein